jgi:hypothetical protein
VRSGHRVRAGVARAWVDDLHRMQGVLNTRVEERGDPEVVEDGGGVKRRSR